MTAASAKVIGLGRTAAPRRGALPAPQPNALDGRRIERSLAQRRRYRYVRPTVHWERAGYRVECPCCSRNIDAQGRPIDIARLEFDVAGAFWRLYSKDHGSGAWRLELAGRLHELLELLNRDPARVFWP
jgi:hypothetical protein